VRAIVTERGAAAGLAADRTDELLLAANEIASVVRLHVRR
jgi:hypothetical protein